MLWSYSYSNTFMKTPKRLLFTCVRNRESLKERVVFGYGFCNRNWKQQAASNICYRKSFRVLSTVSDKVNNSSINKREKIVNEKNIRIFQSLMSNVWPTSKETDTIEQKDYIKDMKRRVMFCSFCILGGKGLTICVPYVFKELVDSLPLTLENASGVNGSYSLFPLALILGYGVSRASASGMQELRSAVFSHVAQDTIRRVGRNTFNHLHSLDLNFHLNRNTGVISRILDRGNRSITFVLNSMFFHVIPLSIEVSIVSGLMAYQFGLYHSLVIFGTLGTFLLYTITLTHWRTKIRRNMNKFENEASAKVMDSLLNYETIKYFSNEKHETLRYESSLKQYQKSAVHAQTSLSLLNFGQNAIFSTGITLIMYLTYQDILSQQATIGDLVLVNGLLFQLSVPLFFIGMVYRETRQAFTDMEQMFSLRDEKPSVTEGSNLLQYNPQQHSTSITFSNVAFSYPLKHAENRMILQDMTFHIPQGKTVAFVGSSGCGKSTILRLLYRFYQPKSGSIYLGTQNINDITIDSVRKSLAVIPQDVVLFNDTILYNINYANLSASKEDVIQAAKQAQIHDTIVQNYPQGYDTIVGERGMKLSGGEKQRVSIARAILKNSPILLCDEPTSSLDGESESKIMNALKYSFGDNKRTTIIIAHRLSTIQDCDEIFVLDQGIVVEHGTHEELVNLNGRYTDLLTKWQQHTNE